MWIGLTMLPAPVVPPTSAGPVDGARDEIGEAFAPQCIRCAADWPTRWEVT